MVPGRRTILACIAILVAGCSQDRPRVRSELADYNPPGTGPFDSRGNYVESWADKPSRWNGRSVPKPPSSIERQIKETPTQPAAPEPQPAAIASNTRPAAPSPAASSSPPPKPKPKPQPQPVKVKPKKPAPIRVTVKKGDTLYAIARRHKTTVTAIKKASGINSDLIKPGQKLVVPR